MTGPSLPPAAHVIGLSALPGMGAARLHRLLTGDEPAAVWARVLEGTEERPPPRRGQPEGKRPDRTTWTEAARDADLEAGWRGCQERGIGVSWPGQATWPEAFTVDPQPPGVLYWRGDLGQLDAPGAAIVGTRHATPDGRATAFELGRDLAAAGVAVVSGLALGLDGSAHAGALEGAGEGGPSTIGVAASAVDVAYPRRHLDLWGRVGERGLLLSETPPGGSASQWRFPARNRLIVALARMVVVVESHAVGGSLLTATAALARGTDLGAVPGPVRAPTCAGTNQLLCDGAIPVRHAGDVLDVLGLGDRWQPAGAAAGGRRQRLPTGPVATALGWTPTSISQLVARTGLSVPMVARELDELRRDGFAGEEAGQWYRTDGARGRPS